MTLSLFLASLLSTSSSPCSTLQPGVRAIFLKHRADLVAPAHRRANMCHRQINIFMHVDSSISVWVLVHVCTYPFCFYIYFTFWLGNSWTWGKKTFMQFRKMHRKSLTPGMVEEGPLKIDSIKSSETTGRTLKYTSFECWKWKTTIRGVVIQEKMAESWQKSSECYDVFHLP